ncbi:polysaccharide deacetylase family protein [Gracilibacillus alcaliphilus]|uniref:polysaccharide deacetylase family protein n=1 Tax=Gracilibacillus alcaliphilus TaxID=1401441 RepID=UPI00195E0537|nr:polysaccharide deacetylase family protein [Gracilibacillus alcaliphilus]MBM7676361.1 hypothetical protein [Gracilibacillus alcaliphilus]
MFQFGKNTKLNVKRKNRKKVISVIVQSIMIVLLLIIVVQAIFFTNKFQTVSSSELTNDHGFIALSYFGVDRSGSAKHISKDELNKHLTVLKQQGFETISQQQILDFYQNGTPLPEKALFLSFEDGRTDSSIFAQKTLEELNYRATMFTYANKMDTRDTKFLKPKDLIPMMNSGYWELGSNGYRLTYTNIFNEDGAYLGEIDENDIPDKMQMEYYNHYLMDYLRDEYMLPKETRKEMEARIIEDYQQMQDIYQADFDKMPKAYAIMHANSLYNGMNEAVERINDKMIKDTFAFHFNRDWESYNDKDTDIYNLNRLPVAPHWPVNHLLMKIQDDHNWAIDFEQGDAETAQHWDLTSGAAEFDHTSIILTSQPNKEVVATLKQALPNHFIADMSLKGNIMGEQTVYLQSSDQQNQIQIMLKKNTLYIYQTNQKNQVELLYKEPLSEVSWSGKDYAFNKATTYDYHDTQSGSRIDEEDYPLTLANKRSLTLEMEPGNLLIKIDGNTVKQIELAYAADSYQLQLAGKSIKLNTSHQRSEDTIYDSIVEDLRITSGENTIYSVTDEGETIYRIIDKRSSEVIDFFIETF